MAKTLAVAGQLGRNGCKQQKTTMNLMLVTGGTIVAEKIKRMLSEACKNIELALQCKSKKIANDRKNKQTNDQPVQHQCASCKTKMNLASLMPGGKCVVQAT